MKSLHKKKSDIIIVSHLQSDHYNLPAALFSYYCLKKIKVPTKRSAGVLLCRFFLFSHQQTKTSWRIFRGQEGLVKLNRIFYLTGEFTTGLCKLSWALVYSTVSAFWKFGLYWDQPSLPGPL